MTLYTKKTKAGIRRFFKNETGKKRHRRDKDQIW